MGKNWDPDAAKHALDLELHPTEGEEPKTFEQVAKARLRENAPLAVSVLTHIMFHSENEALRARVAQYMLDRVIGKATDIPLVSSGDEDVLASIVRGVVTQSN